MNFKKNKELTAIGEHVREQCHSEIKDFSVLFLFSDPPASVKGKIQLGKTSVPSGITAYLLGEIYGKETDFLVEICEKTFEAMSDSQREALLDHELEKCTTGGKDGDQPSIRGHDVEEFSAVLKRRGAWMPDLEGFVNIAKQIRLKFEQDDAA